MLESEFQARLIKKISKMFVGAIVIKTDPKYLQGFPDLLILYRHQYAALECKRSAKESFQPNQEYYLELLNAMSYANVVYPENEEEILDELQQAFRSNRSTRFPRR